jgi:hypothetical protein
VANTAVVFLDVGYIVGEPSNSTVVAVVLALSSRISLGDSSSLCDLQPSETRHSRISILLCLFMQLLVKALLVPAGSSTNFFCPIAQADRQSALGAAVFRKC